MLKEYLAEEKYEELKESNDKHIERYLGLSFDTENYYKKIWRENQNENNMNRGES